MCKSVWLGGRPIGGPEVSPCQPTGRLDPAVTGARNDLGTGPDPIVI